MAAKKTSICPYRVEVANISVQDDLHHHMRLLVHLAHALIAEYGVCVHQRVDALLTARPRICVLVVAQTVGRVRQYDHLQENTQ